MTEQGASTPSEGASDRAEGAPVLKKEGESKDDGRYIIFYAFEDDETGKARPDGEGNE